MEKSTKIITGAVVTSLMAWGAHGALGAGGGFVDRLETRTKAALTGGGYSGVSYKMERDPALTRTVFLSGDDSQKDAAIAAVKNIPGVGRVIWAADGTAAAPSPAKDAAPAVAPTPEVAAAVADCQADVNKVMEGKTINFRSGSAYLAPESAVIIDAMAAAIKPCEDTKVEIQGHTDLTGAAETNMTLSQDRADRVKQALEAKGVPADRLTAKGFGLTQPVENANTDAANAKNRRTVFAVSAAASTAAVPADPAQKRGE